MTRRLALPEAPRELDGPVKAWVQPVTIPTYVPEPADPNPMFFERRVYQGASGRVYPLPLIDRISDERIERTWQAVHLENEYLRVMVLPELGGRIHVIRDRSNGYDLIYRQDVIKPALVGLAGPWVSGGIEFNWPQHHRPATFMPTEVHIEARASGGRIAWFGDHDPMQRLKGMHGVCLEPGEARLELRVRLYNRTPLVQTFLWWANAAVEANADYQSFFPPDVKVVADHARRAVSSFPLSLTTYYGIDYGRRGREGVPAAERPRRFVPRGDRAPNDLTWYANIPVPTSYMVVDSQGDFVGGYDHGSQAGMVHVADHHVAPGKKQWTWGNHDFGYAWDRNLTVADERGVHRPYLELMAGAFTDNQPDFSFLAPGETRTFEQSWYPLRRIGPARQANRRAALSLRVCEGVAQIGVVVTAALPGATVRLTAHALALFEVTRNLCPGEPFVADVALPQSAPESALHVSVLDAAGREVIAYPSASASPTSTLVGATAPPAPAQIERADELYVTGLHLEQYRHATRAPEAYWREALRRDPLDSRCNTALGFWHLRRGELVDAEACFRRALERLLARNGNPYDGEPLYGLGLTLRYLQRMDEAYAAFSKATWNAAWASPSQHALAEIDCGRGAWDAALDHLDQCLRQASDHLRARDLRVMVLRRLGRDEEAQAFLGETLRIDPLDVWARYLAGSTLGHDLQLVLDLALDLGGAGLYADALVLLDNASQDAACSGAPMLHYHAARFAELTGDMASAARRRRAAVLAPSAYCFPARLEEISVLEAAIAADPDDPRAPYYLGNLLFDRRRQREAIALWERAAALDAGFAIVWRNLGIAYFNVLRDPIRARQAYERAVCANSGDARVLYERDQLWRCTATHPDVRLAELERHLDLVERRDDLTLELCGLLLQAGRAEEALDRLTARRFQPWEGGEGRAIAQHTRARLLLARRCIGRRELARARAHLEAALAPPDNLGEAPHPLVNVSEVQYALGDACERCGDLEQARRNFCAAAELLADSQSMPVRAFSTLTYWSALALRRLGSEPECQASLHALGRHARELLAAQPELDYFATSLPALLLFDEDLRQQQTVSAKVMLGQASLGLNQPVEALAHWQEALRLDPSHALAHDLISALNERS